MTGVIATINPAIAALIRDAGDPALDDRIHTLRTELDVAGLTSMACTLELATAFRQAVLEDHDALAATSPGCASRPRTGTTPTTSTSAPSWPTAPSPPATPRRTGWMANRQPAPYGALVTTRQHHLHR
ncbi:hypothetical protein SY2F82_76840 [Streptomyces sp. Y2F8-2]|nr:hypothetical protein SY2F82_76840 [Streptomyces sp. Y2F8-2]